MPGSFHADLFLRILCALFLFCGGIYISHSLVARFFSYKRAGLRWCAVSVLWLWLSSFLFHALMSVGRFNPLAVVVAVFTAVVLARLSGHRFSDFFAQLFQDAADGLRGLFKKPVVFLIPLFLPLLFTALRTLLVPPLGFDFMVYHGVKEAMWIQNGNTNLIDAPNAFCLARTYFGGGEAFSAWMMIPFHGDFMVGAFDAISWATLGLVLIVLGKELGLQPVLNASSALYCLTLPALWLYVGSGYVEPVLILSVMLGFLFLVTYTRSVDGPSLLLSQLSLGIAAGIKLHALPIQFWILAFSFCHILFQKNAKKNLIVWWVLGCAGSLSMVIPWLAWNIRETGYPLAFMPIRLFGVELGKANAILSWAEESFKIKPYQLREEMWALLQMFRWPTAAGPFLDRFLLIPAITFVLALFSLIKKRRGFFIAAAGWMICMVAFFYYPGFSIVRLNMATVTGRFLLPAFLPVVMIGSSWFKKNSFGSWAFTFFLMVIILIREIRLFSYGWAGFEKVLIPSISACSVLLLIIWSRIPRLIWIRVVTTGVVCFAVLAVAHQIGGNSRYRVLAKSTVLHDFDRWWVPAAAKTDQKESYRIAFTSGAAQTGSNWYWYYFYGKRLQNRFYYIPIEKSGEIRPFLYDYYTKPFGDFDSWYARLKENKIDYVMSFFPPSNELGWMEKRPDLFVRTEGDRQHWGLYRIL